MNSTLSKVLIFAAGAVIGVAASQRYFKTKYERLAKEEIADVREYYNGLLEDAQDQIDDYSTELEAQEYADRTAKRQSEVQAFVDKLNELQYTVDKEVPAVSNARVIDPDEFGENRDYDQVYLTYYADGMLTDEYDVPVSDADNVVGTDFVNHFGDHGEDLVHVRNDHLESYFEITKDVRNYSDIVNSRSASNGG